MSCAEATFIAFTTQCGQLDSSLNGRLLGFSDGQLLLCSDERSQSQLDLSHRAEVFDEKMHDKQTCWGKQQDSSNQAAIHRQIPFDLQNTAQLPCSEVSDIRCTSSSDPSTYGNSKLRTNVGIVKACQRTGAWSSHIR